MKHILILFFSAYLACSLQAQQELPRIFSLEEFTSELRKNHPVIKQSNLLTGKADAMLQAAQGAFDPVVSYESSQKVFTGKEYYTYRNADVTTALPIGKLSAGLDNNRGDLLSSESTPGRSSYIGASIPLMRDVLIDKRRAALQKARIYQDATEQERILMLNDLYYDALIAYWNWTANFQLLNIYKRFSKLALDRLSLLRISFVNGDRSAMDTTEARIQWQNYQVLETEAGIALNEAKFMLADYLWKEDSSYFLPDNYIPDTTALFDNRLLTIANWSVEQVMSAPMLRIYDYKLSGMQVERKLRFQELLPAVSVKANLLMKDFFRGPAGTKDFIVNNNRWGIDFSMPLFLREARGNYRRLKYEIRELELERQFKQTQLSNKVSSKVNEFSILNDQLLINKSMQVQYQSLYRNEDFRFSQGESSLFILNSRENKLIELQEKEISIRLKLIKTRYSIDRFMGRLF